MTVQFSELRESTGERRLVPVRGQPFAMLAQILRVVRTNHLALAGRRPDGLPGRESGGAADIHRSAGTLLAAPLGAATSSRYIWRTS